jgi:N-acetyl-gamma-glutamyl-phosphate reductase
LCLLDKAAVEAVALTEGSGVKIIDTSTAHRTNPAWPYGFAELSDEHREKIAVSSRIANPGCHASGFIASAYPLVSHGVVPKDFPLTAYSLTGYSGGGKSLIAEYEDPDRDIRHESHRIYGTTLQHKHLPEMQKICGLDKAPVFSPILGDFYEGMATSILLPGFDANLVWECLKDHYADEKLVSVAPFGGDEPLIYASTLAGKDTMRIQVSGHSEQTMVTAVFDNLGKGASGAAIQNMNILLGVDEATGLDV